MSDLHLSRRFEYRRVCSTSRTKSNSVSHWLEPMCLGGVLDVGLVLQVMITRRGGRDFPTACGVEPIGQNTASKFDRGIMDRHREQVRLELARVFNDQADAMQKRSSTAAERRECEKRQKRISELCDELRRIAAARTTHVA